MSGTAQVCSASVTSTCRASTQAAGTPASASAAATMRLLTSSPVAATASSSRARPRAARRAHAPCRSGRRTRARMSRTTAASRAPLATPAATATCRSRRVFSARRRAVAIAVLNQPRDLEQTVGHPRQRGDDDHRRCVRPGRRPRSICRGRSRRAAPIASASATDVPPNFITTLTDPSSREPPGHLACVDDHPSAFVTAAPPVASSRRSGSRRRPRRESCCGRARRTCSRAPDTAQPADGHRHAAVAVRVERGLRTVRFRQVDDGLRRRGGQPDLRPALERSSTPR